MLFLKTIFLVLKSHSYIVKFSSVTQSYLTLCNPMDCSTTGLPVHHQLPEFTQTHVHWVMLPSNHLILCHPLLLLSSSFPESGSFRMSQFFISCGQSIGISASASVLPMNIQDSFLLNGMFGSPCGPRDSQESSSTPQFKDINSLALSFLYSPTLTFIYEYWKKHSFD